MAVPGWVTDAVFYQIFPDRFANGNTANDPENVVPWDTPPTVENFHGGDLQGIIHKFEYLLDLGITAIYLNPIFQASSNHRYNTSDYYRIDPKLGDSNDFSLLIKIAHQYGIKVVLDGVFNHVGRGFFAFNDLLENQEHSPYRDWFYVLRFPIQAYAPGEAKEYLAWWNMRSLPKLNIKNIQVRKYILEVARYWIERGADGWRLDVPDEIDDDEFWAEFRRVVKLVDSKTYLVGELWKIAPRWVGSGHFDGLMNYPLRDMVLNILSGKETLIEFATQVEDLLETYMYENAYSMYSLLGSHDTERLMTCLEGNVEKVKQAYFFLFSYPGAPAIYYGDEIGMTGGKDPLCRAAFLWDRTQWNNDLRSFIKTLIKIRKDEVALRRGNFKRILVDIEAGIFAFARINVKEKILTVMNFSDIPWQGSVPVKDLIWENGSEITNLFDKTGFVIEENEIKMELAGHQSVWLKKS